jgi:N-sulfoglucosamine sulfohydrolase
MARDYATIQVYLDDKPLGEALDLFHYPDVKTTGVLRLGVVDMQAGKHRLSIETGLMPNRHGAMVNHAQPKAEVRKWPDYLRMLGYLCAAFGKVAHYGQDRLYGFDHYQRVHDAKTVAAFLKTHEAKKPLCLSVGTHSPHVPWPEKATVDPAKLKLPASHVDTKETREMRAGYYTAVSKGDADLGEIIDLVRAELGENVLFIYTSDHGAQWPFGKWNLYDAGIRVPFLAAWPGVIRPASQSDLLGSRRSLCSGCRSRSRTG